MKIQRNSNGHEMVYVHGAVVSSLSRYLSAEVPFVWILGHTPERYVHWWEATVPLNRSETIRAKVRMLSYDIQLLTRDFLEKALSFDDYGLMLVQSRKPMPDTLNLASIPTEQQDNILIKNGAFLRIWLPHAIETASVTCYQPGYLDGIES
jgi:hypothetical protein